LSSLNKKEVYLKVKTEKKRARILVKGKVQRTGFRDHVKYLAKKHRLYGTVENINNYDEDVLIICEGGEKNIHAFLDELETLRKDPKESDLLLLEIKKITPTYEDYTGIYKNFDILRGADEVGERLDEAAQQLKAMRRETARNFSSLDEKYGEISENMVMLSKNLVALNKNIQQSNENVAKFIQQSNKNIVKLIETLIKKFEK